ncbi:RagB/SusD family nutrient uptake outer membrane protein [Fulvivirga sp. M361]|uniref:RagB/SusD family nutrient uptake outer membrane protein n=1 Tax=Fulvivirga sp. M361 TaxID=2594266 RepID=UPI001627DEE5|nr:RagB/SusD family nutrient uptake outer membrane protein [Fulvivirga sp. M361]
MKKYKLFTILLVISLLSCSDFLEEDPQSLLSPGTFPSSPSDAELFLNGIGDDDLNSGFYFDESFFQLAQGSSDESTSDDSDNSRFDIDHYTFLTNNRHVLDVYQASFRVINEANTLIGAIEGQEWAPRYLGGARFYRAWMYFNLVRLYGGNLPLVDKPTESLDASFQPVRDVEAIYRFIESDLLFAEANAPASWTGSSAVPDDGRPTSGAAKTMLAKLYLTWAGWPIKDNSRWEMAASKAREVIDMGLYSLVTDFSELWTHWGTPQETTMENILSFHYVNQAPTRITRHFRPNEFGGGSRGTGRFLASEVTLNQFSDADSRKAATFITEFDKGGGNIITYTDNWGGNNELAGEPVCIKYDVDNSTYSGLNRASAANINIFRYAEVLLILAEADNEANGGPTARAYDAINQVRVRANMPELSGLSQNAFRDAVRDEWTFELAYEAKRRFNLVRWELFDSVMSADARASDGYQPHMIYYPLPELEIGLTGWQQTEGY